jgi:hypothetical protein
LLGFNAAIRFAGPTTVPHILIFPIFRITNAWFGFYVVKPGVFNAWAAGPYIFASHRAGVTSDAFVQIQDHGYLGAYFHFIFLALFQA